MVGRIIDRAIQIHGAAGCTYESPLAHWYDRQRMSRICEGPTEVHNYRVLACRLLTFAVPHRGKGLARVEI